MKVYADKNRTERSFVVGDYIYLKLQPYRQNSLQLRRNLKLAPKYYGPFQVIEKIGEVAYKLKLPPTTNIYPIFHVSLLKKKLGHKHTLALELPLFSDQGVCRVYPTKILAMRLISRRNNPVPQVLVQWESYSVAEATWEDYYAFVAKFPDFEMDPQGRGSNLPGGNVTAIAGGRRRNLRRPSINKSSRMIQGTRTEENDVVPLKKGKLYLKAAMPF
ncbi:UNVERIFIED_CONTAM: hypothetical protein Slati_1525100 [Sesamum latifolium]|uniref:Tf2-1-like SH3-like domain-containing protein n=1 Tax=Sesamum latifolium TaxID=2727402 RepID=A0AAW2XA91_9LAMI